MCKKFIFWASVLVLVFSCTSYADVLLGDFENGSLDGWIPYPGGEAVLTNGTTGVTSGDSSLDVVVSTDNYWMIRWSLPGLKALDLTNVTTLEMDVTMLVANFADGIWTKVDKLSIQSDLNPDWREVQLSAVINRDTGEPASSNDWGTWSGDQNRTIVWDIGAADYDWTGLENSSYVNINIALQGQGLFLIDNIRLNGAEIKDRELYPVLKLDVQDSDDAANVEEGFTAFTFADSGSEIDGITVTIDGYAEGDTRRRDVPAGVSNENIYRDFIFARQSELGVGYTSVTLSGLEPNEAYGITIYSWDTYSTELRVTDWTANGDSLLTTTHDGNLDPPSGDDQAFTGLATADPNGVILMEAVPGEGTFAAEPFAFVNALVISSLSPPPIGKIIWVTDAGIDRDEDGVQDDQEWIDYLEAQNYDVDARLGYWMALEGKDANDVNDYVAELNAADLVILSRTASSGDYDDGNEPTLWNSVTAPMIALSTWHLRSNRWLWIDSTSVVRDNISFMQVLELDHPIFAGVEIDADGLVEPVDPQVYGADVGYRGTCFVEGLDMGNGTLLAKSLAELPWIAVWDAGVEFYDGAGQFAGGPRMMFAAGTQDEAGAVPQGGWNLTDAGEQMFLNSVEYMISLNPVPIEVENASFELPGTVKQNNWDGGTNSKGTFEDVPGWSSDTMAADSGVETGWNATDGEWSGFLKGADDSIWQLTSHVIGADDVIELKVDAKDNWAATTLQLSLYYDDGGVRVTAASVDVVMTDTMQEFSLVLTAADVPEAAGKQLGIELNNASEEGESWIGIDNVRLNLLP